MANTTLTKHNVHIEGNPNATETLLFSHGYGSDQTAWRFVTPEFQDRYRIVLFDLIGCGASDLDEFERVRYGTLYAYADDLILLCDTLKLSRAVLVAHSVSCMIGTLATLKRPDLFSKMIFIGASPRYLNDKDYVGGFTREGVNGLLNTMAADYVGWATSFATVAVNAPDKPDAVAEFRASLSTMRPDISVAIAATIFLGDYRREVAQLKTPTLLIQAQDDVAVPPSVGEYLRNTIPTSQLRLIESTGHFPHLSNPDEIIQAIDEYLTVQSV